MVDQSLEREAVSAVDKTRVLIGFVSVESAERMIRQSESFWETRHDVDVERRDVESLMATAEEGIRPLDEPIDEVDIRPLPDDPEVEVHIEDLTGQEFFQQVYGEDPTAYEIGLVPIDKLIARQASVTVTGHREIPEWESDLLGVIQYTLPAEREQGVFQQAIQSSDDKLVGYQFTSRAPNIQLQNASVVQTGNPMEKGVFFTLRAPPNVTNVWRVDGRLVLNNGYHRTYQLLQQGETHVPAVIRDADALPTAGDFTEEQLLGDRPPVLTDFESDAATTIKKPATNDVIRITAETTEVYR